MNAKHVLSYLFKRAMPYIRMSLHRVIKASPPRLEFGCGPRLEKGFAGVDIRFFEGVEFICNAWEITHYVRDQSVAEVSSRHFLEHLTYAQAELVLRSWSRILRPSGCVHVTVPDIDYHLNQLRSQPYEPAEFDSSYTNRQHAIAGLYGWQREGLTKAWDVHKSGYNFEILSAYLESAGFTSIERVPDKPWNLSVIATKRVL